MVAAGGPALATVDRPSKPAHREGVCPNESAGHGSYLWVVLDCIHTPFIERAMIKMMKAMIIRSAMGTLDNTVCQ
jgi:hypothetical protein